MLFLYNLLMKYTQNLTHVFYLTYDLLIYKEGNQEVFGKSYKIIT